MMFSDVFLANFAVKSFGTVTKNANDTALEGSLGRSKSHFLMFSYFYCVTAVSLSPAMRKRKWTDLFDYMGPTGEEEKSRFHIGTTSSLVCTRHDRLPCRCFQDVLIEKF